MKPRWLVAAAVLVAASVSGCTMNPNYPAPPVQPSASIPAAILSVAHAPTVRLHFPAVGVYEKQSPVSYVGVSRFSAATKTRIQLAMYYADWGGTFRISFADQAAKRGAATLVMLEPWSVKLASIADGHQDKWLRSYAAAIKSFRDPVIIAFGHEMNGCWYPWGPCKTPPRVFTAAWRHVVTVFRQMRVNNVRWLWEANAVWKGKAKRLTALRADYPGDKWVTYVGVTGYYARSSSTFSSEFSATMDAVRHFAHRPLMIGETGVAPGRAQAQQIKNLFAGAKAYHVIAVVYFDVDQKAAGAFKQDWRLEGKPADLRAFHKAVMNLQS